MLIYFASKEREPGQSYEEGFKTYGFAAPFSKSDAAVNPTAIPAS